MSFLCLFLCGFLWMFFHVVLLSSLSVVSFAFYVVVVFWLIVNFIFALGFFFFFFFFCW